MNAVLDVRRARSVISETVKRRFADDLVDRIAVFQDVDSDGDPILRVFVVFNIDISKVDHARMGGLVRHLRSALEREHSDIFPLVSFVSKRDAKRLTSLEAA